MRNDLLHDRMHPGRYMLALLGKHNPILIIQRTRQLANHLFIDPVFADITQRLKHCTGLLASTDKRLGGRIARPDNWFSQYRWPECDM